MKKFTGFTLVETVIVVLIVGVLLSITFSLSFNYVDTMRVKTDKEQMANIISDGLAIARTSNYYRLTRYSILNIAINALGVSSQVEGGDFVTASSLESFIFKHSELTFGPGVTSLELEVTPYSIGCETLVDGVAAASGFITFALESTINTDRYCYRIDEDVCKLNQIEC